MDPITIAGSSELLDSDCRSTLDFTKTQLQAEPAVEEECPELPPDDDDFGYTGEPIFGTLWSPPHSPRPVIDTSVPLLDQK